MVKSFEIAFDLPAEGRRHRIDLAGRQEIDKTLVVVDADDFPIYFSDGFTKPLKEDS